MYRCVSWADNFKIQLNWGDIQEAKQSQRVHSQLHQRHWRTKRPSPRGHSCGPQMQWTVSGRKPTILDFRALPKIPIIKNFGINLEEREICTILSYWLRHLVYTTTVDCANSGSKCNVQSLRSAHDPIAENGDEKMEGNLKNSELVVCRLSDTAIPNKAVKTPMCYLLVPSGIREHMQGCQEVKVGVQVRAL